MRSFKSLLKSFFFYLLFTSAQVSAQTLIVQIDSLIDNGFIQTEPGGVVLLAEKGRIVYERAFGMANMELGVPMNKDMVFCYGSMTKQFTSVAVLRLVDQGRLALTDSVGKFLPDYPAHLRPVTIYQLLTHTSGIPNARNISSLVAQGRGWLSAEQVMSTFRDLPLDFQPGTSYSYSNSGYQLLGFILEKTENQAYAEYMDENILPVAGMKNAFYGNDMKLIPNRAAPYLYTRNGIENACNNNVQVAFSAGAIQGTAEDFLNWQQSLLSEKFISYPLLKQAWTKASLSNGQLIDYGFGWFIGQIQGIPVVEHGGNMGGFMSDAIYVPDRDILVVVLFNFRGRLPELLAQDIVAIALGKPFTFNEIKLPTGSLQSFSGHYRTIQGTEWTIIEKDGKLSAEKTGGGKWILVPYAKDCFFFPNTSTIGEFQRDQKGNVISFLMQTRTGLSRNEIFKVK